MAAAVAPVVGCSGSSSSSRGSCSTRSGVQDWTLRCGTCSCDRRSGNSTLKFSYTYYIPGRCGTTGVQNWDDWDGWVTGPSMYIFPITSRCFTTGWSLTQMNTGGIHSEFLGNFLNTGCRTTARTARIRNKFTKQSSTSNCFPSGCFKFWLLRCLAQTTNKSLAESDRRLTDTEIGMPQLQSTQVQFAICTPCSYATVQ